MSRNGQLIGFCHALPKTESTLKQTFLFEMRLSENTSVTLHAEGDTENFKESEREP